MLQTLLHLKIILLGLLTLVSTHTHTLGIGATGTILPLDTSSAPAVYPVVSPTSTDMTIVGVNYSSSTFSGESVYVCASKIKVTSCLVTGGWITYSSSNINEEVIKLDYYNGAKPDKVLASTTCGSSCTNQDTQNVILLPACVASTYPACMVQ